MWLWLVMSSMAVMRRSEMTRWWEGRSGQGEGRWWEGLLVGRSWWEGTLFCGLLELELDMSGVHGDSQCVPVCRVYPVGLFL
jgi:hypothetical protein